jgi:8-hydroxy-5-deazaflavin:NADPH oxidoreductase
MVDGIGPRHHADARASRTEVAENQGCKGRETGMKIGIIGSGEIGATVARLFAKAGHQVAISNQHGPETLKGLVAEIGGGARAATPDEIAVFGELVLVAIPYGRYRSLPAGPLVGRVVVDAMNYNPGRDGHIDFDGLTSTELLGKHLAGATMVKAFNTMEAQTLATAGQPSAPRDQRLAIFVAADDAAAKAAVSGLIEEVGFAAIDTGTLHEGGRRQHPDSPLFDVELSAEAATQLVRS